MKLEDLYKSELSDLNIEPRKGSYEKVKTALVNRIVRNTFLFSAAFALFFVGLGELAKYKKTRASQEIHFPNKILKSSQTSSTEHKGADKEWETADVGISKEVTNSANSNFNAKENSINENKPLFETPSNSKVLKYLRNYVEVPREAFYGILPHVFIPSQDDQAGRLLSVLGQANTAEYLVNSVLESSSKAENNQRTNEEIASKNVQSEEQKELDSSTNEESSFPTKKVRKLSFSAAAFYGFNNSLQNNAYQSKSSYVYQLGITYPVLRNIFRARLGVNLGMNHHQLTHTDNGIKGETDIDYMTIEIPLVIEYPIPLKHNFIFTVGTGTRLVNNITQDEKTTYVDGNKTEDKLFEDKFKNNYFTFFSHFALSKQLNTMKINFFLDYQPTLGREIILKGKNSIYNEYGVSNLQLGIGIDF